MWRCARSFVAQPGQLLQILDEGRLTDAEGRTVSFRHALIILTSNIGTGVFTDRAKIGFSEGEGPAAILSRYESVKNEVFSELKKMIRPELLARLDHSIVMNALGRNEIDAIVRLELAAFKRRLKHRSFTVSFPERTIQFIAEKSFAPEHGARLIRKNIETFIERPLAEALLAHTDKEAKSFVLEIDGDRLVARAKTADKKRLAVSGKRKETDKKKVPTSRKSKPKK